ncbi:type VI secretion system tube protein TssD [Pedobacter duraquae]|uniref:YceI-like domain-containing protein n=1 Tax=Pedobacter duraquae TaxID=425511 RepID=A0A4R6IG14_9SPHI|nr:type VI secretion system tube protein TssD [Pedobacter duraquae]TDO21290.1 hypothetical protein CLV32_2394 [Pedobacter duraquae]
MKKSLALALALILSVSLFNKIYAQSDENRTKLQLTINSGGKTIVTDLNSVSTSLSRSYDEAPVANAVSDTAKNKSAAIYPGGCYLTMDAKKISDDLLKVFSKKQTRFDGTITIVDTYGKNPTRTIKFTNASLYSFGDQFSTNSYNEAYGATSIAIMCKEISINGVVIEQ